MMSAPEITDEVAQVVDEARSLDDHDELVAAVAGCRTVLIGEASHGTDEFYRERAAITRRLIEEHGFGAVAIEGDWPDARRLDAYVRGRGTDRTAVDALDDFRRFPSWMWRNAAMLDFVGWLADHNESRLPRERCGIFGLDIYSMHASAECVLRYLEAADPAAVPRARQRYECLDGPTTDPQHYARQVMIGSRPHCEQEMLEQLIDLTRARARLVGADDRLLQEADDAWFDAQQNALVARNAERYYRTMFLGSTNSWNLRDRHMSQTLLRMQAHLARRSASSKVVVWAHNSHVGDARATEMGARGQLSLGQLVREAQGDACALIGFTTHHGSVTAARDWDRPSGHRHVLPALEGSHEHLFHETGLERFVLLPEAVRRMPALRQWRLERAIGVIYRPETERASHYFDAVLARQFDAVIHIDATRAVEPLERTAPSPTDERAETWPFGT